MNTQEKRELQNLLFELENEAQSKYATIGSIKECHQAIYDYVNQLMNKAQETGK